MMTKTQEEHAIDVILAEVRAELVKVAVKHGLSFASPHEGYAVIQEEVDELWDDVKANEGDTEDAVQEAIQIAAMGVKYVLNFG